MYHLVLNKGLTDHSSVHHSMVLGSCEVGIMAGCTLPACLQHGHGGEHLVILMGGWSAVNMNCHLSKKGYDCWVSWKKLWTGLHENQAKQVQKHFAKVKLSDHRFQIGDETFSSISEKALKCLGPSCASLKDKSTMWPKEHCQNIVSEATSSFGACSSGHSHTLCSC